MIVAKLINSTPEWMCSTSTDSAVVMSSRLRLARNLEGHPFPTWGEKSERQKVYETVVSPVRALPVMKDSLVIDAMDAFSMIEKQLLVEQHLVSREHAAKGLAAALR